MLSLICLSLACGSVSAPVASGGTGGQDLGSGASSGAGGGSLGGSGGASQGTGGDIIIIEPPVESTWDAWLEEYPLEGPYEEDRPEAPEDFVLPIPVGAPGWRDSTEPTCTSMLDVSEASIWADEDGVAVLAHAPACNPLATHDPCGPYGSELWYNDGSGWKWLWGTSANSPLSLAGVPGGDLLVGGPGVLVIGRDGTLAGQAPEVAGPPHGLFGGAAAPAYAVLGGDPEAAAPGQLYTFDGMDWTGLGMLASAADIFWSGLDSDIAAADGSVYLIGLSGIYRASEGDDFEVIPDVPVGEYVGVSATADDNVWAANAAGQILHYDGEAWDVIGQYTDQFYGFWNDGESAYFVSDHQFGRATTDSAEILQESAGGFFRGIAGVSSTEILVTLLEPELIEYACDSLVLLAYDGEEFHRF